MSGKTPDGSWYSTEIIFDQHSAPCEVICDGKDPVPVTFEMEVVPLSMLSTSFVTTV